MKNRAVFLSMMVMSFGCNLAISNDFEVPVVNPYMDKFHWSLRPDVRAIMALDSVSRGKLDTCVAKANEAGHGAEDLYNEHFRNDVGMTSLKEGFTRQKEVEGYKPVARRGLDPWSKENTDDVMSVLSKRTLDLMWGYYQDYESPVSSSKKTSTAQQVMWDFCMSIPKELFVE
ncbi:hypothetical protein [uncultured Gilvimarinus sp.]|uniref:hypothetical protein n=1 Tax=uncultured Gilvimarinus sp. TaxID=1689143 RepID=UPI0030ED107A